MSLLDYLQADPECRNLAEGAIHAVAPMLEDPDPAPTLALLDAWAYALAGRMPLPWSIHGAIDALNEFLFDDMGLQGDRATYDDPLNAVLPRVIERKKGLPIALSILWIDLARRMGMDAVGVALPGHFIAALRLDVGLLHVDPFNLGRPLGQEDAQRIVRRATQGKVPFELSMLEPVSHRAILLRVVRNLYHRFVKQGEWEDALWAATHQILLLPDGSDSYRDRAFVHLKRGDVFLALADLQQAAHLTENEDIQLQEWIRKLKEE